VLTAYHCLQDAATALEPVTTTNHTRARLHHNIGTHTHLLHGVLKLQGVAAGSARSASAPAVQDLILQLLQQQPHESRLYLALVLLYAAAGSWNQAAAMLKTVLKMLPDWTEGSIMLGCAAAARTPAQCFLLLPVL
jgi:predicted Zn-dependent protease